MIQAAVLYFAVNSSLSAGGRSFDGGVIAVSNQCSSGHRKILVLTHCILRTSSDQTSDLWEEPFVCGKFCLSFSLLFNRIVLWGSNMS